MSKSFQKHRKQAAFEDSEVEVNYILLEDGIPNNFSHQNCINILKRSANDRSKEEMEGVSEFFRKFDFFIKMPCKFVEIKEQEINGIIAKCLKYMKVISFNSQEILIERGKQTPCASRF